MDDNFFEPKTQQRMISAAIDTVAGQDSADAART